MLLFETSPLKSSEETSTVELKGPWAHVGTTDRFNQSKVLVRWLVMTLQLYPVATCSHRGSCLLPS